MQEQAGHVTPVCVVCVCVCPEAPLQMFGGTSLIFEMLKHAM